MVNKFVGAFCKLGRDIRCLSRLRIISSADSMIGVDPFGLYSPHPDGKIPIDFLAGVGVLKTTFIFTHEILRCDSPGFGSA